ncbi:hypothetical protein RI054_35g135370 [Pseudoscourfieldia marina]
MKKTPRRVTSPSFVGAILYAAVISRPDLIDLKRSSIIRRRTKRTKHIEIRREFIKFHIGHETVKIERVSTKDQLADIMTKPPRQDIHNYLVQMILHG